MKRTKIKLKCPNPLFEKWLQEWRDEAAKRNSDFQYVFEKALLSLKKYPLPLQSGRDCMILENFGTRLCLLIDRKLAEHMKLNSECNVVSDTEEKETKESPKRKKSKGKEVNTNDTTTDVSEHDTSQYIPAWRSAPYAILIALYNDSLKMDSKGEMNKQDLLQAAQSFTDTSMYKPLPGSYYTGWSSMSQLVKKSLVLRKGNPARFSLTAKGIQLAKQLPNFDFDCSNTGSNQVQTKTPTKSPIKLITEKDKVILSPKAKRSRGKNLETAMSQPSIEHVLDSNVKMQKPSTSSTNSLEENQTDKSSAYSSQSQSETIIFMPGSFQVILLVDTQEISKGDEMVKELRAGGVLVEVRRLKVGDFVWVSRNSSDQEVVLPYIIERKRLDDLAHSIKDGRFHEQKFRLKQCGIPNCIYLVERFTERHYSLPLKTLLQATTNTQVIDNFTVKFSAGYRESVIYLTNLSSMFCNIFKNKTLISCEKSSLPEFNMQDDCISLMTFKDFSRTSGKFRVFKVKEMFVRHLLQLRGLSVEKALSIVEMYQTPRHLIQAYRKGGDEKMLAGLTSGSLRRPVGVAISKAVFQLYNSYTLK